MKTPNLIPLDMTKAAGHIHPDIKLNTTYLCLIDGEFYVGTFNHAHFGLNFLGWYGRSLQFDAPGENSSDWQAIWEVVLTEPLPETPRVIREREAAKIALEGEKVPAYARMVNEMSRDWIEDCGHRGHKQFYLEITPTMVGQFPELEEHSVIMFDVESFKGFSFPTNFKLE